jgi:phosphatidylglycerophosphatase A
MNANPHATMQNEVANPRPASGATAQPKPRLALFVATAGGLGYLPVAPGTWGSLAGVAFSWVLLWSWPHITIWESGPHIGIWTPPFVVPAIALTLSVAALGVWASDHSARFLGAKDPQIVVVDEVSGQMLPLLFAFGTTERYIDGMSNFHYGFWWHGDVRWKYLLLGFILFRVFDIWKPFPVRQAESLPGGWGIMADDWVAGSYAAIGLWIARSVGL